MKTKELIKKSRKPETKKFEGYLFVKLHLLGSYSQGPRYYLQQWDGEEVIILKKAQLWQPDPVLEPCLGKKVVVYGKVQSDEGGQKGIAYTKILNTDEPLRLDLKMRLKDNTLWINKMPGPPPEFPPEMKRLNIRLSVQWPYREEDAEQERSTWKGECPTSQLYDFWIEDPRGKVIWQWSKGMLFRDEATEVYIPGGSPRRVRVPWYYFEDAIMMEGIYEVRAQFIASGQEIREAFEVRFAV